MRFELGDTQMPIAKEHGGSTTTVSIGPAIRAACVALQAKLDALIIEAGVAAKQDPLDILKRGV